MVVAEVGEWVEGKERVKERERRGSGEGGVCSPKHRSGKMLKECQV